MFSLQKALLVFFWRPRILCLWNSSSIPSSFNLNLCRIMSLPHQLLMAHVDRFEKQWWTWNEGHLEVCNYIWKIINMMETLLLHVAKVFYRGILKESNFEGTTVSCSLELLFKMAASVKTSLGWLSVKTSLGWLWIGWYIWSKSQIQVYFFFCVKNHLFVKFKQSLFTPIF